jgi:DNA-binding NarL/FixJ family response regulator
MTAVITFFRAPLPELKMPMQLLLADDSDVMRSAIVNLLKEDPRIEVVGQAASFADTLRLTTELRPDVVLLDLYMRDDDKYSPDFVGTQIVKNSRCILAVSISNDEDARALARRFRAKVLLDKNNLYSELIPAILRFCQNAPKKTPFPASESSEL